MGEFIGELVLRFFFEAIGAAVESAFVAWNEAVRCRPAKQSNGWRRVTPLPGDYALFVVLAALLAGGLALMVYLERPRTVPGAIAVSVVVALMLVAMAYAGRVCFGRRVHWRDNHLMWTQWWWDRRVEPFSKIEGVTNYPSGLAIVHVAGRGRGRVRLNSGHRGFAEIVADIEAATGRAPQSARSAGDEPAHAADGWKWALPTARHYGWLVVWLVAIAAGCAELVLDTRPATIVGWSIVGGLVILALVGLLSAIHGCFIHRLRWNDERVEWTDGRFVRHSISFAQIDKLEARSPISLTVHFTHESGTGMLVLDTHLRGTAELAAEIERRIACRSAPPAPIDPRDVAADLEEMRHRLAGHSVRPRREE